MKDQHGNTSTSVTNGGFTCEKAGARIAVIPVAKPSQAPTTSA